jgi:23S rRNA (cytosine1962-C5)-methyltransferase
MGVKHLFLKGETAEQKSQPGPETESRWLLGSAEYLHFVENGLEFQADPVNGQKTGFFVDQRSNRERMAHYAKGRSVLECFSYSAGFGVYALKGGAKEVLSVDGSQHALTLAQQHVSANFGDEPRYKVLKADVFEYLKNLEETRYDLILLDPPAFSKHISTVDRAARGYKELNMKALAKLPPGGLLFTFSCSQDIDRDLFRKILFSAAADIGRPVRILEQLTQGADHPVDIYHPEGEYLKGLILEVD